MNNNTEQNGSERADGQSRLNAGLERKEAMERWDSWRAYIAEGGTGSWPRDAFENLLDTYDEIIAGLRSNV